MGYTIRNIGLDDFKNIYDMIERDFQSGEYAPYSVLYKQLQEGVQKGLVLLEGECEVAYAICADGNANGYVLISLLAVYDEFRGKGVGTAFLEELKRIYSYKNGIIVEVEKPENAASSEESTVRKKRIKFYQKAGFYLIPDIDYSIWDMPMYLMALPQKASNQIINEKIGQVIYEIYFELMGKRFIHKMKFKMLK